MRWQAVWGFVLHMLVGSLLFALLFGMAVGLEAAAAALKKVAEPSEFLINMLTAAKYVLAVLDLVMYFLFLLTTCREFLIELWWPGHEQRQ